MANRVRQFYDNTREMEWDRLNRHRMEFETTFRAMREHIPPQSTILDVGGGPGRYSIELSRCGHEVTLLDLSPKSVELAREKAAGCGARLKDHLCGDALDLSRFGDATFDVVLLMGPLYHLTSPQDRDRAIKEAVRVLREGGLLFATFITRYAVYVDLLKSGPGAIMEFGPTYERLMETGVHIPTQQNPGFTDAFFIHPNDIEPLMSPLGLTTRRLAVAEGLIAPVEPAVNALPGKQFDAWVEVCYKLGTDPITWGAGEHMLYVGSKVTPVG